MTVWQSGDVTLYHGDCLEVLPTLAAGSVDAVVTDPPYGNATYDSDTTIPDLLSRLLVIAPTVAIFGYPETLVAQCIEAHAGPDEWITWWPTNKTTRSRGLMKEVEAIAIFGPMPGAKTASQVRTGGGPAIESIIAGRGNNPTMRRAGDVWQDASPGMGFLSHLRLHPNEKPISLMKRLIDVCSSLASTVLDPCMGSGTTGVACVQTGRRFIGIEIGKSYFDIACKRIAQAQMQMRMPFVMTEAVSAASA